MKTLKKGGDNSILELQRKMERVVSRVYEKIEALLAIRKTYEEQIQNIENTIKENNKEVRKINKEIKALELEEKEAEELKAQKEKINKEQKDLQEKIPHVQENFEVQYEQAMQALLERMKEEFSNENDAVRSLERQLEESQEEEKKSLMEVQNKIESFQKLNRAEMPDSFRERLLVQIKEQEANKQEIQKSFEQKREILQLKIEEARKQPIAHEVDEKANFIEEVIDAMKQDEWKQAEKLWKSFKKLEKIEEKEVKQVEELKVEKQETENIEEEITNIEEATKVEAIEQKQEEKPAAATETNPMKVNAIYIDMVSEKIYADIGKNEGNEYNFEKDMKISMLDRENNLSIIKRHVPNFARIVEEKEKNIASEKSKNDYKRYLEIFEKVDPFVLAVLDESHEDLRKYLKAIKNSNKEEMPCELFYNLKKLSKTEFSEEEQEEILEYVEKNACLATQIRGIGHAKRIRKWRKFENKHAAFRAVMRWLRMEEEVKQLTDGK